MSHRKVARSAARMNEIYKEKVNLKRGLSISATAFPIAAVAVGPTVAAAVIVASSLMKIHNHLHMMEDFQEKTSKSRI